MMGRYCTSAREIREIIAAHHPSGAPTLTLSRVRLSGDYERGAPHVYWGSGEPLWRASDEKSNPTLDTIEVFVRAPTRDAAKHAVAARVPNARFYR